MSKNLFIIGTSSGAGKSTVVAGLCRLFAEEGLVVAPFKSQNMTNVTHETADGRIIARSSAIAAAAARREPEGAMNPIVLRFARGQMEVILEGRSIGILNSDEYHRDQAHLWQVIDRAYGELERTADLIILEGAGSPVEMNLKDRDIANLAMAQRVRAPILLVADVDRGGVFAAVCGTLLLMEPRERALVKGIILNRLSGDPTQFAQLKDKLEALAGVPVVGMLPYLELKLEDEDDLVDPRTGKKPSQRPEEQSTELDHLAGMMRQHLDLAAIERIIEASGNSTIGRD